MKSSTEQQHMGTAHAFNSEITTLSIMIRYNKNQCTNKRGMFLYNLSKHFYDIISGLQSLCIKSQKEKQIGFIRTVGYHEHICGVERVFPLKVLERYFLYFTTTIISSKTSAAINVYQNLLASYRTKKHWFKAPNSLLEYFTL